MQPASAAVDSGIAANAGADLLDVAGVAADVGYPALADLDIQARRVGATVSIARFVPKEPYRRLLVDIVLTALSDVSEVNTVELYHRPPLTYTVQAGDSLWSIAADFSGDGAAMETISQANLGVMDSASDLCVGSVLTLPREE